jgi:hypothetical protein
MKFLGERGGIKTPNANGKSRGAVEIAGEISLRESLQRHHNGPQSGLHAATVN